MERSTLENRPVEDYRSNDRRRCRGGKLLTFGDEKTCVNCGWIAPASQIASPYRMILLGRL